MNPIEKISAIKDRLIQSFSPSYLDVIDDSDQHVGHAGHKGGGRHFTIVITAQHFSQQSRVDAHREIYAILDDLIPEEIHALRIKIVRQ